MSFAKVLALFPMIGLVALLAPVRGEPEKPKVDPEVYEIRLADGSAVKMRLLTDEIELTTRYGDLRVPIADIRRIDVGFRYPEGAEKRVALAVIQLGATDFKAREAASAELLRLRELAYPALKRALKSEDQEVKRRAADIVRQLEEKVPAEKLRMRDQDIVYTAHFPIVGRIKAASLKGHSPVFGEVQVQFADTRQVRSLSGSSEVEVTVDATRYASPQQDQWMETEVEVERGVRLKIRAGGMMNLNPQNGNNFVTGPEGTAQWGQNGPFPPGMLIGRIGLHGQPFQIRSQLDTETTQAGKLYLRIGPSPWGQQATGAYSVTISTELGLGGMVENAHTPTTPKATKDRRNLGAKDKAAERKEEKK